MNKAGTIIVAIISVILIGAIIFFGFTPGGRSVWNSYTHSLEKLMKISMKPKSRSKILHVL